MEYDKDLIEQLVEKAKNGESDAFGQVYDVFVDGIYRYIYFRVKNDEVEDLVEIVFLRAWEHIGKYKKNSNQFSSWLFRIAHNLVVDYYRNREKDMYECAEDEVRDKVPDTNADTVVKSKVESAINASLLRDAMVKLPRPFQEVIVLKFINNLENSEIGKVLGKSEASIRVIQFRALKELKKMLQFYDF